MGMIVVTRYNECIEENFDEVLGLGFQEFEMDSDTTVKEMMKILLDIDDEYIKENFDNVLDCWGCEIQEDEIYLSQNKGNNIVPLITKKSDFKKKIGSFIK